MSRSPRSILSAKDGMGGRFLRSASQARSCFDECFPWPSSVISAVVAVATLTYDVQGAREEGPHGSR